jgi:hypothetical protein
MNERQYKGKRVMGKSFYTADTDWMGRIPGEEGEGI